MARITSKQAQEMMNAYASVYANKEEPIVETPIVEETPLEDIQERISPIQQRLADKRQTQQNLKTATQGYKFSGSRDSSGALSSLRADPVGNKPTPQNAGASAAGAGNAGAATQARPQAAPSRGTPFRGGYNDGSPPEYTGGPNAAQRAAASVQKQPAQAAPAGAAPRQAQARPQASAPMPSQLRQQSGGARAAGERIGGAIGGAVDSGINKAKGGLRALGNLAGRAVGAVKQGVQSGVNTAKRVAGGTADAITGNMTDFDKRGGKPQGLSRAVAGGVDKLTGDRTDLDKRGVTPLNAGQRAQFQKKPAGTPAGAGAAAASAGAASKAGSVRPTAGQAARAAADTTSPAAKSGMPAGMRAQAAANNAAFQAKRSSQSPMDRRNARLAAAKNKGRPLANTRHTQVMDLESYDPMEDVFDDTINFLVSEGYVSDEAEALTIMAQQEFMEAFNEGYQQVLNEEV